MRRDLDQAPSVRFLIIGSWWLLEQQLFGLCKPFPYSPSLTTLSLSCLEDGSLFAFLAGCLRLLTIMKDNSNTISRRLVTLVNNLV